MQKREDELEKGDIVELFYPKFGKVIKLNYDGLGLEFVECDSNGRVISNEAIALSGMEWKKWEVVK